jgi:archaemetzincin
MSLQHITLISFGYFDHVFLKKIAENIRREFAFNVQLREGHLDITEYYDAARRQCNADKLLKQIDKLYSNEASKTIALFNIDLFIPIFTYIFGQAYLGGQSGIVSIFRLSNERYGIDPDEELLLERSTKEIIHELGHTLGLIHCHVPDCVMRSGTYVEDIDQKSAGFCPECRGKIKEK